MTLIAHPADATVFAPDLPRTYEATREPWRLPRGKKLAVSILLHAPSYQDTPPARSHKPIGTNGGVGRETSEPRHGQVTRLSQWDFGLTVGIWRLLGIAKSAGVPVAVALDQYGVREFPGLASLVAERAQEIVVRGAAANIIIDSTMSVDEEREYIATAKQAVEAATGRATTGWFGPERGESANTTALLSEAGFSWFGDWPVDERPVALTGASRGLVSVPYALEAEDSFSLFTRGVTGPAYERILTDSIDQLLSDAETTGARHLGLSLFGWVSGQACFADIVERTLLRLAAHPDVLLVTPSQVAALAGHSPATAHRALPESRS